MISIVGNSIKVTDLWPTFFGFGLKGKTIPANPNPCSKSRLQIQERRTNPNPNLLQDSLHLYFFCLCKFSPNF